MESVSQSGGGFLISIVIATYNAEANLLACLESIRSQSLPIEIVVMDGASTDKTISILVNFEYAGLRFFSEPDQGIYDALNKGLQYATGHWIYFIGSDDVLLPGFSALASQLRFGDTVYYGIPEAYYLPGKKPDYILLTGSFSRYRLAKYPVNHQSILYPKRVFEKYVYSLRYRIFADYALNMRVWGDPEFKRKFLPIPIVRYNMTGFSSLSRDDLFHSDKPRLIKKYLGLPIYLRWLFKFYKKKFKGETF